MNLKYFLITIVFFTSTACLDDKKKGDDNVFQDGNNNNNADAQIFDEKNGSPSDNEGNGDSNNKHIEDMNNNDSKDDKQGDEGGKQNDQTQKPGNKDQEDLEQAQEYLGFGKRKLGLDRIDGEAAKPDRMRIKPFGVLADEYQRVTGVIPESLAASRNRFAPPPNRWFTEPERSSLTVIASFNISYEAALKFIENDPDVIVDKPAREICRSFALKAWSRTPSAEQLATCVEITSTKVEINTMQKWAYAFASILTSSGFVGY
ncbi:MAG: hypothetical protein AB8G05_24955 [Oligoflexales bacterium]